MHGSSHTTNVGINSATVLVADTCIVLRICCCSTAVMHRSEFVFINPNAKGSCGCGESFTT
jgi:hypothetical protein